METRDDAPSRPPTEDHPAPAMVGRYHLLRRIAAGATGVVYRGHDPRLDRDVAIKLLRPRGRIGAQPHRVQARLAREAQAIAALDHPNIVVVYDVGISDGGLFIAMELVEGESLRKWIAKARQTDPLDWRRIVEVFRQAARGLGAAHERGLVHRDFKPDNAMVTTDGVLKVLDFGLARAASERTSSEIDVGAPRRPARPRHPLGLSVTETGTVLGTPAYMAPEQHFGEPLGPATDQFALCVTLYEALYGQRPYRIEDNFEDLAIAKATGRITAPPSDSPVPREIRDALLVGLRPDPAARWSSMQALDEALEAAELPRRRARRTTIAAAVLALGAGLVAITMPDRPHCTDGDAAARVVEESTRLRPRFGDGTGRASWSRMHDSVTTWARSWEATHRRACEGPPEELPARTSCLQRSVSTVRETLRALEDADGQALRRAVDAVDRAVIAGPHCDRDEVLQQWQEVGLRNPGVAKGWAELDRVLALENLGRYDEALAEAHRVQGRAEALGARRLAAAAWFEIGSIDMVRGFPERAEAGLLESYFAAVDIEAEEQTLVAAIRLALLYAAELDARDEARKWIRTAEAAIERGAGNAMTKSDLLRVQASLAELEGDYDEAVTKAEASLETRLEELGPDGFDIAAHHHHIATYLAAGGRFEEASEHLRACLRIWEPYLGDEHPDLALVLDTLGSVSAQLGDHEAAVHYHRRALHITEAISGADSRITANILNNLGIAEQVAGQLEESERHLEQALVVERRLWGFDAHPDIGRTRTNLGLTYGEQGRHEEALSQHRTALEIFTSILGAEHLLARITCVNVAEEQRRLGDPEAAIATIEPCLLGLQSIEGTESFVALARGTSGQALADAERLDEAVVELERAVTEQVETAAAPRPLAETRFALARVLAKTGGDVERAELLAEQAYAAFAEMPRGEQLAREAQAWLERPRIRDRNVLDPRVPH